MAAKPPISRPKLALVGPVLPYRGGIAQYTTQLHQALRQEAGVAVFSFKKLYPMFLYPGKSDKEPGMENHREPGVVYSLNIFSPFSWYGTARKIKKSGAKVAIITWWTLIWQPGLAYMAWVLKRKGVKAVFLCHNLYDHDTTTVKSLSKFLLKRANAYIVHSSQEAAELAELKPAAPVLQRDILPVYDQFPAAGKKLAKRGRLELLFFGFVRTYKGLDVLVEALAKLNDTQVHLTVVGEAWGDVAALRGRLEAMGAPNVELKLEYVSEKEAANYFERADVVMLPYLSATGSAVLSLAYYYGKPVVATSVGGFRDAVKEGKTGWLIEPNSAEEIADVLGRVTREQAASMRPAIDRFCKDNSWAAMAEDVAAFCEKLAD